MTARKNSIRAAANRSNPSTPAPGVTALRTKAVRTTVDLEPDLWAEVGTWTAAAQGALMRKVTQVDVIRALLALLVNDDEVADKVRARLGNP